MNSPRALTAAAAAVVMLTACDVPTDPPIFEPRWIIPVDETSLSVDELLPAAIAVAGDNFDVSVDPVQASETLGDLCGAACDFLNGTTAPVPSFSGTFVSSQALPDDVLSAEVAGGSIDVVLTNGFDFDPLLNDGSSIVITVTDELTSAVLGDIVLDDAYSLNPGATLFASFPVEAGTVTGPLRATTSVEVVGGQEAFIDVADVIDVTATIQSLLVSEVTVDVGSRQVSLDPQEVDLEDIESDITDRIVEGAIILDIENPFGVSLDGTIEIGATSKPFSVAGSGSSTVILQYTGNELRSFIGQPNVFFTGSGVANGSAVTIRPGQVMSIDATLDFTIQIG